MEAAWQTVDFPLCTTTIIYAKSLQKLQNL
jgi:hypothetical protein